MTENPLLSSSAPNITLGKNSAEGGGGIKKTSVAIQMAPARGIWNLSGGRCGPAGMESPARGGGRGGEDG